MVTGESWADISTDTTLRCTLSDPILRLKWRNSSFGDNITDADNIVVFTVTTGKLEISDATHYEFDQNDPGHPLTIKQLTLEDEAKYWCEVYITGIGYRSDSLEMQIRGIMFNV